MVADDADEIAFQLAAFKCSQYFALVIEYNGGRFNDAAAFAYGGHFNHAATDVAFHQAQTAVWGERVVGFAQDVFIAAGFRGFAPFEFAVDEERLFSVVAHTVSDDGINIVVQQACVQQFADNERQAAGRGKVVHVGFAVWIHTDQQWDDGGNFVEVVPVQNHACGTRHGDEVHGVVGRAAGCHQADQGVDEGFFGQHFT